MCCAYVTLIVFATGINAMLSCGLPWNIQLVTYNFLVNTLAHLYLYQENTKLVTCGILHGMLLKRGMGNGEWGMGNGNGEWEIENGKWEIENGKLIFFYINFFIMWNKFF